MVLKWDTPRGHLAKYKHSFGYHYREGILLTSSTEARDAAQHPTCTRQVPSQRIIQPKCQQCQGWETLVYSFSPTSHLPPDPWGHWSSSFLSGYTESTQAWEVLPRPPHFCQAASPPALFPWLRYNSSLCRSSGCHSICLFLPPNGLSSSLYLGSDFKRRRRRLIIKNVLPLYNYSISPVHFTFYLKVKCHAKPPYLLFVKPANPKHQSGGIRITWSYLFKNTNSQALP